MAKGHALDIEEGLVSSGPHVARVFAEWTFGFDSVWRDLPLQNDFRCGRNFKRNGFAGNEIHRLAAQRPRDRKLIQRFGHFRYRYITDRWVGTDDYGDRCGFVLGIVL